jgi:hypothetical protein
VIGDDEWFVTGGRFIFFLPFFLSFQVKVHVCSLLFLFFNFSPKVFDCLFLSFVLLKKNYVFNLVFKL